MTPQAHSDRQANPAAHVVRFAQMIPCKTAFIDARTPGSDKKENFCLIGNGVAENPDQHIHIDVPHSMNIGAARQPHGCKNSHHSHETEEVFMIFKGQWEFTWGEDGSAGAVTLSAGDVISLPTQMFRGFENTGEDDGFMFSILGLDEHGSAGNVIWAPYVFEAAQQHGLVLLEDGRLIDTRAGDVVPEDGKVVHGPDKAELNRITVPDAQQMAESVFRSVESGSLKNGGLGSLEGVHECSIIGAANTDEAMPAGKINRPHSFHLRLLTLDSNAQVPAHVREEEEILIVQSGELEALVDGQVFILQGGDLMSIPISANRSFCNPAKATAIMHVVRGGASPKAAIFL